MRTDIEMKMDQACKLLSMGKLSKKSENFINSLKRKKNIRKLTKRQYDWLSDIAKDYKVVSIFKNKKED
jgi:hypothetical protein